jgi:regulator of sigma E protease
MAFIWNLLSFILVIGIIVVVHEYGHFWVARRCGVKVLRFSIGFGKPLFKWYDKLGTEYVVAAIPLGGYVKMLDERVESVAEQDKPHAFNNKSVYQRIAIVAAGPLANFIFAIVVSAIMFMVGVRTILPVIGDVVPDSLADNARLQAGQQIIAINDQNVFGWRESLLTLMENIGDQDIKIDVKDPNLGFQQSNLDLSNWRLQDNVNPIVDIGIIPFRPTETLQLANVQANSPALYAGLQINDIIHLVDGEPLNSWQQFVAIVEAAPNKPLLLTISRGESKLNVEVTPGNKKSSQGLIQGYLGVIPFVEKWPESMIVTQQHNLFNAILLGTDKTYQLIKVSFATVINLITGQVSVANLSGPVGVAIGAGASTSSGAMSLLDFLVFVSVSIGFFNLLPLPILDGGHLMYYIIELIRKKPVSEKTQELGFRIGALVLVLLTCLALFNDFTRL